MEGIDEGRTGYTIILIAIVASIIGTFFLSNTITGFATAREGVSKGDFASVTGKAIGELSQPQQQLQLKSLKTVASSLVFGLLSVAVLIVVARMGKNAITNAMESRTPAIQDTVKKAESAVGEGKYENAYALYNTVRELYAKLEEWQKQQHYARVMQLHSKLARQAATAEAHYLTEKYVNGTITEEEFERLKQIIASQ